MLKLPTNYLAGYEGCCSSGRVFFSYQPKWFIIPQCFFFLSLFTTDTNAGQSHRLTNCRQNLHRYNLKSLIFKHSLLFIHTFKTTTQVLRPIAHKRYISSFNLFHLVQNIGPEKINLKTDTFGSFFPTTPRQRSNPQPREGLTNQIPHSPGTENRVKRPRFAREGLERC